MPALCGRACPQSLQYRGGRIWPYRLVGAAVYYASASPQVAQLMSVARATASQDDSYIDGPLGRDRDLLDAKRDRVPGGGLFVAEGEEAARMRRSRACPPVPCGTGAVGISAFACSCPAGRALTRPRCVSMALAQRAAGHTYQPRTSPERVTLVAGQPRAPMSQTSAQQTRSGATISRCSAQRLRLYECLMRHLHRGELGTPADLPATPAGAGAADVDLAGLREQAVRGPGRRRPGHGVRGSYRSVRRGAGAGAAGDRALALPGQPPDRDARPRTSPRRLRPRPRCPSAR